MALRAVLCDLDGTLYQDGAAIPGAPEALARLRGAGLCLRFVTNTSTTSRVGVADRGARAGISIDPEEIHSAMDSAAAGPCSIIRSVSTPPGLMALAVIPSAPFSKATALVKPFNACLKVM